METIVIIGAGASGLACMNELVKTNKYNIIVLEQSNKAARKILASGNGRCNVSNLNMDIKYYNHQDPLIEKLIKEFDVVNFFSYRSIWSLKPTHYSYGIRGSNIINQSI